MSHSRPTLLMVKPVPFAQLLPLIALNAAFFAQAIAFDWVVGTLLWVYWAQGLLLVLLGLLRKKYWFFWLVLLSLMTFYGLYLAGNTFHYETLLAPIGSGEAEATGLTKLPDAQWPLVFINCGMLLAGYALAYFMKQKDRDKMFGFSQVVKRVITLHLVFGLALLVDWSALVFLGLKFAADTVADLLVLNPDFVKKYVRKTGLK